MKFFSIVALATFGLAACGTNSDFMNTPQPTQGETVDSLAAQQEAESMGLKNDGCTVSMSQSTYTKSQGGNIVANYQFLILSKGDRIRITNVSSGTVAHEHFPTSASGVLSLPVSSLPTGQYRVQGFMNVNKSDQVADCGAGRKVIIRVQ